MYYVYWLQSQKDNQYYIGCTSKNPDDRLKEHNNEYVKSSKSRIPFKLIFCEKFSDKQKAYKRERFLKHPRGYQEKLKIIKKIENGPIAQW
ncbi:MAG: GIY-YIG nuclease family protein [bacterium]